MKILLPVKWMFVIKLVYIWNDYLTALEIGQILGKKINTLNLLFHYLSH